MAKGPTKAQLEELADEQHQKIIDLTAEHTKTVAQLQETKESLAAVQGQLVAAQEVATAAEAARAALQAQLDDAAATAAHAGQAALTDQVNIAQIPRPRGSSWSIQESMQITPAEYAEIQRTIRNLVIHPDKLSQVFRAARAAHLILQRYANNWATAAIARQYMQNKRKHAYKQGYISKRRAH